MLVKPLNLQDSPVKISAESSCRRRTYGRAIITTREEVRRGGSHELTTAPASEYGYTTYDDYDIDHISTTATSRSATSTSKSTKHLHQLKNSSQQRPRRHLRPRHPNCDCGREEEVPEGDAGDEEEEKRMEARDFKSSPFHSRYD